MFKDYDEVLASNDFIDLLNYCKDAVIENKKNNGGEYSTWDGGCHITDIYLENHPLFDDYPDEADQLIKALNDWISELKTDEQAEKEA